MIKTSILDFVTDGTSVTLSSITNMDVCVCVCVRDEDAPAKIEDPDAMKPEGWLDDEAEFVPDPNAEKPEDW